MYPCYHGIELAVPHSDGTRLDVKPDGSLRLRLSNFSGDVILTKGTYAKPDLSQWEEPGEF